jgi:hypothetical protein
MQSSESSTNQHVDNTSTDEDKVQADGEKKEVKRRERVPAENKSNGSTKNRKVTTGKSDSKTEVSSVQDAQKYTQEPGGPLVPIEPTVYVPSSDEPESKINVTKGKIQKDAAIAHMVEVREWTTQQLDRYDLTFLTHKEATTHPYGYSSKFTSPWGGIHFPYGKTEPNKYYGQLYNWYPNEKCKLEHIKELKKHKDDATLVKYVTRKPENSKLFLLDPKKYLDPKTTEPIVGIAEDLQGAYLFSDLTGKRFVANTSGCNGVLKEEIESFNSGKRTVTELSKVVTPDETVFIFDNDVFTNFGVFHAAIRVLLYGGCRIKVLSKDTSSKIGLDEFARAKNSYLDYKDILAEDLSDFLNCNSFNFIKSRYSPNSLFKEVGNYMNGLHLQKIQEIYYGEKSNKPIITFAYKEITHDMANKVERAIAKIESIETVYRRSLNTLIGVSKDGLECTTFEYGVGSLMADLDELFEFKAEVPKKDNSSEKVIVKTGCPKEVAERLIDRTKNLRLKELDYISKIPVLTKNGKVLTRSGYHEDVKAIISLDETRYKFDDKVSKKKANSSLDFLKHVIREFDFVSNDDKSGALAMLLTGASRKLYMTAPFFVINAHTPGTGKSALANVLKYMLLSGNEPNISYQEEEELNKKLLPVVNRSPLVINIDNAKGLISNSDLEIAATEGFLSLRTLGMNKYTKFNAQQTWVFNGNNLQYSPDFHRRMIAIGLNKLTETPKDFEVENFEGYLEDNAHEILEASLDVVRGFIQRDVKHDPHWPTLIPSFGSWDSIVRRSLLWLGQEDPWNATKNFVGQDDVKIETGEFFMSWYGLYEDKEVTASDLTHCLTFEGIRNSDAKSECAESLYSAMKMMKGVYDFQNQFINTRLLARELGKMNGQMASGYRFVKGKPNHQNKVQYQVTKTS